MKRLSWFSSVLACTVAGLVLVGVLLLWCARNERANALEALTSTEGISLAQVSSTAEFTICTATGNQYSAAIYGNIVVWDDWRDGDDDIYGRQIRFPVWLPITLRNYSP